jgi:hypothetical protein
LNFDKTMTSANWHTRNVVTEYILCHLPTRADMAKSVAKSATTVAVELNPIEAAAFADGEPNITVPHLHALTGRHVVYLADWSSPAARYYDLCALTPIAEMVGGGSLTIVVPFFGRNCPAPTSASSRSALRASDRRQRRRPPSCHRRRSGAQRRHSRRVYQGTQGSWCADDMRLCAACLLPQRRVRALRHWRRRWPGRHLLHNQLGCGVVGEASDAGAVLCL